MDELIRMGVSLTARKHPVLTTLRETKARVMPIGEVALRIPSGTQREIVTGVTGGDRRGVLLF